MTTKQRVICLAIGMAIGIFQYADSTNSTLRMITYTAAAIGGFIHGSTEPDTKRGTIYYDNPPADSRGGDLYRNEQPPEAQQQEAALRPGLIHAAFYPATPEKAGCYSGYCGWEHNFFDGTEYHRCDWRCPHGTLHNNEQHASGSYVDPPKKSGGDSWHPNHYVPADPYYEPDSTSSTAAVGPDPLAPLLVIALFFAVVFALYRYNERQRDLAPLMEKTLAEATEAVAAREKLEEAQRNADAVIKRQTESAFGRGRDGAKP